jgi:hypothetical protein
MQIYGLVILSFMAGVIWGFATRATGTQAGLFYALSVVPPIWAFFAATGATGSALLALLARVRRASADRLDGGTGGCRAAMVDAPSAPADNRGRRMPRRRPGGGTMSADKETLGAYAARIESYDALQPTEAQTAALSAFLARLAPGAHILDIGCGPGTHAVIMQGQGFAVTAWDASPDFVERARARASTRSSAPLHP